MRMTPLRRIALGVLAGIVAMAGIGYLCWPRPVEYQVDYKMPGNPGPKIAAAEAAAIERREHLVDQTIWRKEMEAQEYGRVFEDFWDALNAATNKWEVVERLPFESIVLGEWKVKESLGYGIERWIPEKKSETRHLVSYNGLMDEVRKWKEAGWGIMQCEFRHNAFDPQTNDIPAKSKFYFSVHLTNASPARATVEGDVTIDWKLRRTNTAPTIMKIDASKLEAMFRGGPPAFTQIFNETFDPPRFSLWIEPLLVYDLDGDDIPEIALPSLNILLRLRRDHYQKEKFCSTDRLQILNGLFADFDGDGITDFLYLEFDGVFLLKGSPGGNFRSPPRLVAGALNNFSGPRALTCGDIDSDGDLDIFVGQYRPPLESGTMPTPYYDSNDAYPCYLLLNDGNGNFRDATEAAGLSVNRFRRVLGTSFVDLDGDGALDLMVTSDFAGVDVYRNDGRGKFVDVTKQWIDEAHAFGMSHAFADFNGDGLLDFVMAGMTSATASRLEHFGISRPNSKIDAKMRAKMSFGNRLYFAKRDGGFFQSEVGQALAPGWTWGVCAADFDNDGFSEIYFANGMLSGPSVRDVEGELWLHDIFVGTTQPDPGMSVYFSAKSDRLTREGLSQGGYDKNRLYLNRGGREFVDIAHLLGVALQADSRNVVAADVDHDGRVDLVVTSIGGTLSTRQTLQIFKNNLEDTGNWIEFDFRDEAGRRSAVGASVLLNADGRQRVEVNVTGDSFRSQRPNSVRFGLGTIKAVESAQIRWPGGALIRIAGPQINQAHSVSAPMR